jgi:hypothetical protein
MSSVQYQGPLNEGNQQKSFEFIEGTGKSKGRLFIKISSDNPPLEAHTTGQRGGMNGSDITEIMNSKWYQYVGTKIKNAVLRVFGYKNIQLNNKVYLVNENSANKYLERIENLLPRGINWYQSLQKDFHGMVTACKNINTHVRAIDEITKWIKNGREKLADTTNVEPILIHLKDQFKRYELTSEVLERPDIFRLLAALTNKPCTDLQQARKLLEHLEKNKQISQGKECLWEMQKLLRKTRFAENK